MYSAVEAIIKEQETDVNPDLAVNELSPVIFMPARPTSIHVAVKRVWPGTSIAGCRFHLGQCWFRHIKTLGLQKMCSSKSVEGSFLRALFGLPFLRPADVEVYF